MVPAKSLGFHMTLETFPITGRTTRSMVHEITYFSEWRMQNRLAMGNRLAMMQNRLAISASPERELLVMLEIAWKLRGIAWFS